MIVLTLIRTIVPYLVIWLGLMLAFALRSFFLIGDVLSRLGFATPSLDVDITTRLGIALAMDIVSVYFTCVSMRLIGLYYLHFKRRFAFQLE